MIDGVEPIPVGSQVEWMPGSRLAGVRGVVVESGSIWSFVNVSGSDRQEHTKTALLALVGAKKFSQSK